MKTKLLLTALLVISASLNLVDLAAQEKGKDQACLKNHRIDIRVNTENQVVLRAACVDNHKWVNMVLKVYNQNGEVVFAESFHKKGGLYKGFDMSKLPQGRYTFEIHQKLTKVYSKEVMKFSGFDQASIGTNTFKVKEL
jgi:hypothetical protein